MGVLASSPGKEKEKKIYTKKYHFLPKCQSDKLWVATPPLSLLHLGFYREMAVLISLIKLSARKYERMNYLWPATVQSRNSCKYPQTDLQTLISVL